MQPKLVPHLENCIVSMKSTIMDLSLVADISAIPMSVSRLPTSASIPVQDPSAVLEP